MNATLQLAMRAIEVLHLNCSQLSPSAQGIVASAVSAILAEEESTDTERLAHLAEWDRCVVSRFHGTASQPAGSIEKIEFIFENVTGEKGLDAVRRAIDKSIEISKREPA